MDGGGGGRGGGSARSFSPQPCVLPRWKTAVGFVYVRIGQLAFGLPPQHCSWPGAHGAPCGLPGQAQLVALGPPPALLALAGCSRSRSGPSAAVAARIMMMERTNGELERQRRRS